MKLISSRMRESLCREERLRQFRSFARDQFDQGRECLHWGCLMSEGYADFYGKARFDSGLYRHNYILPDGENPNVLLFDELREARSYATTLQQTLRDVGFLQSWARAMEVSLRLPDNTYAPGPLYIIEMEVRKG